MTNRHYLRHLAAGILLALIAAACSSTAAVVTADETPAQSAESSTADSGDAEAVAEPADQAPVGEQTIDVPAGVDLVTVPTGFNDVTFAVLPPTKLDPATCTAVEAWYEMVRDMPRPRIDALIPGTDLGPLMQLTSDVELVADGEVAVFVREWASNRAELQAIVDALPAEGPSDEITEQFRAVSKQIDIYDREGITSRVAAGCGLNILSVLRDNSNHFSSIPVEAPDTVIYAEGLSLDIDAIALSDLRIAAIWADPLFGLGHDEEYRASRNPWLYVDFTMTNTGDAPFDNWRSNPFSLVTPNGGLFNATSFQSSKPDTFRELLPGETRSAAFVVELTGGQLRADAIRNTPDGIEEWAVKFSNYGEPTLIGIDGTLNPPAEAFAGNKVRPANPEPDTTAPDTTTAAPNAQSDNSNLTPTEQAEVAEFIELLDELLGLNDDQGSCTSAFLTANAEPLVADTDVDGLLTNLVETCRIQPNALRVGFEFRYSDDITTCVMNSIDPDELNDIWRTTAGLVDDEANERFDEIVASYPGCS